MVGSTNGYNNVVRKKGQKRHKESLTPLVERMVLLKAKANMVSGVEQ